MTAQVLSPAQVAARLGVDPSTVRRWVRSGAVPDVFSDLPTARIGVPVWWVDQLVSSGPVVGVPGEGAPVPLTAVRRDNGRPNFSVAGHHPATA